MPAYGRKTACILFCKAGGQGRRARLPGKAVRQGCQVRLPGALEIRNISECIARVIQIWSKLVETRNISECMEKLDNNVVFAEQGCYAMLNAWRNWTRMQYFEQCHVCDPNNKNNKAKLRPALNVRTNAGKNEITLFEASKTRPVMS
jgi:hypothetical protein